MKIPPLKLLAAAVLFAAALTVVADPVELTAQKWQAITHDAPVKLASAELLTENGAPVWKVSSDYSAGGKYGGIELLCKPEIDIDSIDFSMRSPAKTVGVCAVDSTGQGFLRLYPLSGNADFVHRLEIKQFDAPPGTRSFWYWGGANDGKFHRPLRKIQLRTFGDGGPAGLSAWSDCYFAISGIKNSPADRSAEAAATPVAAENHGDWPDDAGDWRLFYRDWPTEPECSLTRPDPETLAVKADFSSGETLAGVTRAFYGGLPAAGMTFLIKTAAPKIFIEAQDARRQVFYQSLPLSGNPDEWQTVTVKRFYGPKEEGFQWSGGFDGPTGVFRLPVETVNLLWHNGGQPGAKTTLLRDFRFALQGTPAITVKAPSDLIGRAGQIHRPRFQIAAAPGSIKTVAYQILDYDGKVVADGASPVEGTLFTVPVPVSRGFYEISFPQYETVLGCMMLDEPPTKPDLFFAIDTNFSVNRSTESAMISEEYLKILQQGGIRSVHDRTLWRIMEPERGKFRWNNRNADILHQLYNRYGMKVLDTIDGAPRWTGSAPERSDDHFFPYPRDLGAAGGSVDAVLQKYALFRDGLEVWNEPENSFGAWMPGDQVTAFQKLLVYRKSKLGDLDYPVISGALTGNVMSDRLMQIYCANGMIGNSDVFSFHTYHSAESMIKYIKNFRDMIAADPNGSLPFRVTEGGMGWTGGKQRAPVDQDKIIAAENVMKAVECKAAGVERYSLFTLAYYEEPPVNFGLFDAKKSPHRHLHAFLYLSKILAGSEYLGDLAAPTGVLINRVFADGEGGAVIVAYCGRWQGKFTVPAGLAIRRATTIDGRELPAAQAEYPVTDGVLYLFTGAALVRPLLSVDTEAMRQRNIVKNHRPCRLPVKPGVISFDFVRGRTSWTLDGYRFEDNIAELPLRFNNAGAEVLTFRPDITLPPGGKLLAGLPEHIEVPPESSAVLGIKVDLSGSFADGSPGELTIYDRSGNATDLVIPLLRPGRDSVTAKLLSDEFRLPEKFDRLTGWMRLDDGRKFWKQWEGPAMPNVRVAFRVFYTPDKLRLIVLAEEKVWHQPYTNFDVWRADSVQIGLRTLDGKDRKNSDFGEFCIAQTKTGPVVVRSRVESPGVAKPAVLTRSGLTFDRIGNLSRYVIDFDRAECGLPELKSGTEIGFSLLVNNSEGTLRDGYIYWGDGIGDIKSAEYFNRLKLK